MEAKGYSASNRKYLMFAEANNLCGIAQVYPTSAKTSNYNNGFAPMFARVDSACWTSSYHSVASHELMHTLGSVMSDSLHPSVAGHCTDDYDVMCYVDGPSVTMTYPCPAWHEQLYDCGHDDYFSTDPAAGSYLATHWNTADSAFLDVVPPLDASATLTLAAPATLRPGLSTTVSVTDPAPAAATYSWSVTPTVCLVGSATTASITVMCPSDRTGSVDVSVYRAASGQAEMGVATIDPLVTGPDGLDVALTAPASVSGGSTVTVGGTLSAGGQPVRGTVTWYSKPATGGSWVRVGGPAATTAAGTTSISTMPSASTTYELVVAQPVGSTWTASPAVVTVTVVKKPVTIASSITVGRPDKVRATMASGSTRVAGASVGLYYHYSGSTKWVLVQHYTTGSTGGIVVSVQPKRYTYYLWSYAGSAVYSAAQSKAVYTTY